MFRNKFEWFAAYFSKKEEAENAVEGEMQWFEKNYNPDEWSITSSVNHRPMGWIVNIIATKNNPEGEDLEND